MSVPVSSAMSGWLLILLLIIGAFLLLDMPSPVGLGTTTGPSTPVTQKVEINGNPGVILHADSYWGDVDNWTPAADELQAAEDAVRVAAPMDGRDPILDGYRQYVGIIEDGERKIVINSSCQHVERWEDTLIQVDDGGPCFWMAIYNVETGELDSLVVNGFA